MAENKRQHFVPQFYLKYFSINSLEKTIGIFSLPSSKFTGGPIGNQAKKDYFYGSDLKVEKTLGKIEGIAALIINRIISSKGLPENGSNEHETLLTFFLLLHARTVYYLKRNNEFINNLRTSVLSRKPELANDIEELEDNPKEMPQSILQEAVFSVPLILDLHFKLVVNKTNLPFIISDHPVVLYNQLLESKKNHGSNTGFASKGLQIIIPLSPNHILFLFDKDVYGVGNRMESLIVLDCIKDVDSLNLLQCLSANENLYFNQHISESYILRLLNKATRYRRKTKANVDEFVIPNSHNMHKKAILLLAYNSDIRCNLCLSFVQILKKAKKYELNNKTVHVRNEESCRLYNQVAELLEKGKYRIKDLDELLEGFLTSEDLQGG
jgi:hypothetical protein